MSEGCPEEKNFTAKAGDHTFGFFSWLLLSSSPNMPSRGLPTAAESKESIVEVSIRSD